MSTTGRRGLKVFLLSTCMSTILVGTALMAPPAAAAPTGPSCSKAFLGSLNVSHVTITSVTDVPAAGGTPEFCDVIGAVATYGEGAGPGTAQFQLQLPVQWNDRLLFVGCGATCGSLSNISAEAGDTATALPEGYAIVNTDAGHEDATLNWTLLVPGVANTPALTDFYYRAVHQTTAVAKDLVKGYYSKKIEHAYFDGCSNGGRQAMVEVDRYPDDFDGVIAGDPAITYAEGQVAHLNNSKLFAPMASYIPSQTLTALDNAVMASCDAADGVVDGLIQNPAKCSVAPQQLAASGILTSAQAAAFQQYLSPVADTKGRIIFPGYPVSDLAGVGFLGTWTEEACPAIPGTGPNPWAGEVPPCSTAGPMGFSLATTIAFITELNPNFDVWDDFPLNNGVVGDAGLAAVRATLSEGSASQPKEATRFLDRGGKLILYHGFSDPSISPYQTVWFYRGLAQLEGGVAKLQKGARLFLVPGMSHCAGGPGPNTFATLDAMDAWVSQNKEPNAIVATNATTGRSMPLCPFPEEATFRGGDVDSAQSWACEVNDRRLLEIGLDGKLAHADATPDPEIIAPGHSRDDDDR